ncbi:MAG: MBL fold metallo-hydrolase [bacterium]
MKITMISHCCLLIELGGKQILTDPWMTEPLYGGRLFHRFGLGLQIEELPPLDLIVASHGHDDHLDPGTLRRLDPATPVLVLAKVARKVRKLGFSDVFPMAAGEQYRQGGLWVQACPGKHPGGLVTYVLRGDGETVFFAGDSAYHDGLLEVGRQFTIDVSLLPVSGGRTFFGKYHFHMNAGESARVAGTIQTRVAIPTHYHFDLRRGPGFLKRSMNMSGKVGEFVQRAAEICPAVEVVTLGVGQSWSSATTPEPGIEGESSEDTA